MAEKKKQEYEKYRHIKAWGLLLGSGPSYVRNEQKQALADNAPLDAVYKRDNAWILFSEVTNQETRETIGHYLRTHKELKQ